MSLELVIFDCDGVLVDSEWISVGVEVRLLAEAGWPLRVDEVIGRFVGRSDADMLAEIEQHLGRPLPDWNATHRRRVEAELERSLRPVPGVVDAIQRLVLPTRVASSGSHRSIRHRLEITGLLDRFEGRIHSAEDVSRGKPAPDLFLRAAQVEGVSPGQCVVVEDSVPGVEAARRAGMAVLAYAGGPTPAHWLRGPGTKVFHDMTQLPLLVDRLNRLAERDGS